MSIPFTTKATQLLLSVCQCFVAQESDAITGLNAEKELEVTEHRFNTERQTKQLGELHLLTKEIRLTQYLVTRE